MEEQSISPALSLWRYFRTKGRNAWWVLKTKGLQGVWRNVANELLWLSGRYTIHQANADAAHGPQSGKVPKVPDSAFVNKRKVLPPSPRPTSSRIVTGPAPSIDRAAIGQAICRIKEKLRCSIAIKGSLSHDDQ